MWWAIVSQNTTTDEIASSPAADCNAMVQGMVQHDTLTLTLSLQGRGRFGSHLSVQVRGNFGGSPLVWSEPVMIGTGKRPKISVSGEMIDVVWEDSGEIYHRKKGDSSGFGAIENISNSPNRISKNPIVFSPYLVVWLEEPWVMPDSKFDLVYCLWKYGRWIKGTIGSCEEYAYSPKGFYDGTRLFCIFVYGNQPRYGLKFLETEILPPYRTSDTKLATASNNAKRLVLDEIGRLHTFYRCGDYLFYNYEFLKQSVKQVQDMVQNDRTKRIYL